MNKYEISIINKLKQNNYSDNTICCILAQTKVESMNYTKFSENLNYINAERILKVYPNRVKTMEEAKKYVKNPEGLANLVYDRKELGNINIGDGWKYRGRGLAQITGKSMYKLISDIININLVDNPELLNDEVEINSSVILAFCDIKNIRECKGIEQVSIKWNGGKNALDERIKEYNFYISKM